MDMLIVFGAIAAAISFSIAYRKKLIRQFLVLLFLLLAVYIVLFMLKAFAVERGISSDILGIVLATLIEFFIARLYPWVAAPLLLLLYTLLKKREH